MKTRLSLSVILGFVLLLVILIGVWQWRQPPTQRAQVTPAEVPVMSEAEVKNAVHKLDVSYGFIRSWLPRPDLEGKTFKEILTQMEGKLEQTKVNAEPPTTVQSLSFPVHVRNSTSWVTIGFEYAYLPLYTPEFIENLYDLPVTWAVETPGEPHISHVSEFEAWIHRLRRAKMITSSQ